MTSSAQNSKQVLAQQGSATVPAYSFLGDQDTGVYRSGANEISVSTNGTQRAVVNASGNVGIGTASPDALLTVNTIASFGDGAVTTPSIAHKGDLNTGLWFPAADTIAASTAGSERMRITSAGDVGIGTSTPANYSGYSALALNGSTGGVLDIASGGTRVASIYSSSTSFNLGSITDIPVIFLQNSTEYARFDTDGNFFVGYNTNTSAVAATLFAREDNGNAAASFHNVAQNTYGIAIQVQYTNTYFAWFNFGTTTVGSIGTDGSSTSYNTTSDYRLKTNVQPLTGSLQRILSLEPSTYDWLTTGERGVGFIAHKLAEHIPEAVTGEKDAVDAAGNIKPQGVDLSKIVPDIVAAMQEQQAQITSLLARVAALEAK